MKTRIEEATQILIDFKMPKAQINDRTAQCFTCMINLCLNKIFKIERPLIGITPIWIFQRSIIKKYAPNSRGLFED
jgi:hypothetical protein